jgi:glycosyltransferase involved in cell wall biosynthesis
LNLVHEAARDERRENSLTASVIIATYTERRWYSLCRAVTATLGQDPTPHEVIVVVDHNRELLKRARKEFAGTIVIANTCGRGDAGSANCAVARATGDVIALVDDDAVPESGWLGALLGAYTGEDVLGVGGLLTPQWESARPGWFPDEFLWVVGCSYRGLPRGRAPVRNLIGANMSVRRDLFLEVGGFREELARVGTKPFAGREAEFCIRAARARPAGHFIHEPAARVTHLVTSERARFSYFVRHCHDEGFAKATLSRLVGHVEGLSEERSYVARTLPSGVGRGIAKTVSSGKPAGALRSASIAVGAATAAVGYLHGLATSLRRAEPPEPVVSGFSPVKITEIELSGPLPNITQTASADGRPYGRLLALIRLHGTPLGLVTTELRDGELGDGEIARLIWDQLGSEATRHLAADGRKKLTGLTSAGILDSSEPVCRRGLDAFKAEAPFVSVIIPTRDRADQLRRCLDSLLASDYPDNRFEVIVVDNGSITSDTEDLVHELRDGRVLYIEEAVSGSASARNAGARIARGDLFAFTDDDVRIDREWLLSLARAFSVVSNVGCVTGLILPMEIETPAQALLEEYGGFAKGFERRIYDLGRYRPPIPTFPFSAGMLGSGTSMAFSAAAFRDLGGFDPSLGNGTPARGGVDIEMFFRTIVEGYRLVYEPRAIVHHADYRDYGRLRRQIYVYGVGLSAFLTRSLVKRPDLVPDFLRRLPSGIRYALSATSEKHAKKSGSYPAELRRLELLGMLVGPFAYARSRRSARRARRHVGWSETRNKPRSVLKKEAP